MSQMANEGQGSQDTPVAETGGSESINPAWNELLSVVPPELHSQVTPHLKNWDSNYQKSINEVHSQYEAYKPYIEKKVAPDTINYALELLEASNARPMEVIKALTDWTKQNGMWQEPEQQGQQIDPSEIPSEFLEHPEFKKLNQMVQTMAQTMVQQNQFKQQQEEDAKLEAEMKALQEKFEHFDPDWIIAKALQDPDKPLEAHAQAYQEFVQNLLAKQNEIPPGPQVMGRGGLPPSSEVDIKSLDGKGRRDLIAQMLQNAATQGQ